MFVLGCDPSHDGAPQGDAVVTPNSDSVWHGSSRWVLSPTPEVVIGSVDGPEETQLHGTRITPVRLGDGRIVVALHDSGELRFFGPDGGHRFTAGGLGGGPGEFERLSDVVRVTGDTLMASDAYRVSWLDPHGRFGRDTTVDGARLREFFPPGHVLGRTRLLPDGSLLATHIENVLPEEPLPSRIWRKKLGYLRVSLDLIEVDTIGQSLFIEDIDPRFFHERRLRYPFPPFPSNSYVGYGGRPLRICFGDSEQFEVRCRSVDSPTVQVIRYEADPVAITRADLEARKTLLLSLSPRLSEQDLERTWRVLPERKAFPAFRGLYVDEAGFLWVEEYRHPAEDRTRFLIFDVEARLLGSLELPLRVEVGEIGRDYLLGVRRDELQVPYVHLYELRRGEA